MTQRNIQQPYPFLDDFGGTFIMCTHKHPLMKTVYEKQTRQPYTGSCVGTAAALADAILVGPQLNRNPSRAFLLFPDIPIPIPRPEVCVMYQIAYEKDPEHFLDLHMRKSLKHYANVNIDNGLATNGDPGDLIKILNIQNNEIVFIKTIAAIKTSNETFTQDHMLVVIKTNGQYIFFDPDKGIAFFNNSTKFTKWLEREIDAGALSHFKNPKPTKLLVHSHVVTKNATLVDGTTQVMHLTAFRYPTQNPIPKHHIESQNTVPPAKL